MKSLFALLLLLASNFAFACPDLTGTFACTSPDGQKEDVTMSQRLENNITIYNMNGQEYPADGLAKPIDENDMTGSFTVTCEADKVKLVSDVTAKDNSYTGHQEGWIYRTPVGLKQESTVTFTSDGKTETFDLSLECLAK